MILFLLIFKVSDVCSLGCCSKFWREICDSDHLWKSLCEERWPGLVLEDKEADQTSDYDHQKASTLKVPSLPFFYILLGHA